MKAKVKIAGIVFAAMLTFIVVSISFTGCEDEKAWWEDKSKILIVLEDSLAAPNRVEFYADDLDAKNNIKFDYLYDGFQHEPKCQAYVDGEQNGYVIKSQREVYDPTFDQYIACPSVDAKGNYYLRYTIYKDNTNEGTENLVVGMTIKITVK